MVFIEFLLDLFSPKILFNCAEIVQAQRINMDKIKVKIEI